MASMPTPRASRKPSFQRNQYGFQAGGPVAIPRFYNGRNKTFFFGSYEQLNDSTPGAGFTSTVPTALERTGDFSQTFNSNGTPLVIYDPSTTQQVSIRREVHLFQRHVYREQRRFLPLPDVDQRASQRH